MLSHRDNMSLDGRGRYGRGRWRCYWPANKRLNTAYLLKELFGQFWSYHREGWRDGSSRTGAPA